MSIYQPNRVEWSEGAYLVIVERKGREMEFWERDSWEVRWYRTSFPSAERIARAKRLFKSRQAKI